MWKKGGVFKTSFEIGFLRVNRLKIQRIMPIYSLETQVTNWWTHKVCAGYVWRAINEIPCLKFSFEMFNHQILTDLVWSRSNTRKCLHISDLSTMNFWMACLWCRDVLRMVRAGGENSGQCLGVFQRDKERLIRTSLYYFFVFCASLFCFVWLFHPVWYW